MPTRDIIGWLSEEDRERYVVSYARVMVAMSGNPQVHPDDAEIAVVEDQKLYAELRRKYEIPDEDGVTFGLFDGAICEGDVE